MDLEPTAARPRSEVHPIVIQAPLPRDLVAGLRRYLGIYSTLWRNSIVREMSFKANFLLWIFVELLWFSLQLAFMLVIYQHTDRIAT